MNDKYEERLGTDRMLPLVFRMALPAVIAQIVNLLYNIVDRIYIGHIPGIGTQALAGIGVAGSLIILISAFSAIVAGGGAPLAAIALGQGNRTHAGKILGNGFVLLLFFTLLTSGLSYLFMEPILLFTGASEQTLGYATAYLSIYLIGTLFVEVSVGLNTFINTQGRPGIAMLSIVIGALLNILLDPLFIFVFDWGVKASCACHYYFTGLQCWLGIVLSDIPACFFAARASLYEAGPEGCWSYIGVGSLTVYYGKYRKLGRICAERFIEDIR